MWMTAQDAIDTLGLWIELITMVSTYYADQPKILAISLIRSHSVSGKFLQDARCSGTCSTYRLVEG